MHHNRAIRRLKNEGQVTMAQLLGDLNSVAISSGSDSDFLPNTVKKGEKGVDVQLLNASVVKLASSKNSCTPYHDFASSINSVYVTGVKSPLKTAKNATKEVKIPSSDGFLCSD